MRIYRQRCSNLTGSLPPRPCVYMDSISTWTKITTACSVKRSWPGKGQEPAKHFLKTEGNMGLKVLVFLWEYSMLIKRSVSKCFLWLLQKRYMYYIVEIVKSFLPTNVLFQVWNRYPHAGVSRSSFSRVPYIWRRNGNFVVLDVPVNVTGISN